MTESLRDRNNAASRKYRKNHPERNRAATKRWRENNRDGHRRMSRDWQRKNQPNWRRDYLKYVYGLTQKEFEDMRTAQDNRCAICQEPFTKTPHIDHDHATEKNRDLLCRFCNLVLGNARDRIAVLERAVNYLKKHGVSDGEKAS
jgi:hypothetical protein